MSRWFVLCSLLVAAMGCNKESVSPADLGADSATSSVDFAPPIPPDFATVASVDAAIDPVDPCATLACENSGVCVLESGSATCVCTAGFGGATCENNLDDCTPNPCQNDGICVDGTNVFTCTCAAGFDGPTCENNVDDCTPNPCQNDGVCLDGTNVFTCTCAAGFDGPTCENNVDDCTPNPCGAGTCSDGVASFTCACPTGYAGPTCACSTGAALVNYGNRGTSSVDSIHDGAIHVTGSATIQITDSRGLGIVGGTSNVYVDSYEYIDFAFDRPASDLTIGVYRYNNGIDPPGTAMTIEAFSPSGVSLGVKPFVQTGVLTPVTVVFGGERIGRLRLSGAPDGLAIWGLLLTLDCPN